MDREYESMDWEINPDNIPSDVSANTLMELIMMDVDYPQTNPAFTQVFVVPDTNIFIHSLVLISDLLNGSTNKDKLLDVKVVLPWTVLQELDGLRKRIRNAQIAINYINTILVQKHPKLRSQKPSEIAIAKKEFQASNEDDNILLCALQLCDKIKNTSGKVIFVTDDKNLRNKAVVCARENFIVCHSNSALLTADAFLTQALEQSEFERIDFPMPNKTVFPVPATALTCDSSEITQRRPRTRSRTIYYSGRSNTRLSPKKELTAQVQFDKSKGENSTQSKKRRRSHSQVTNEATQDSTSISFSPLRKRTTKITVSAYKCNSFADALSALEETISYIIEFQMKEDFGENWKKCLKVKPPWTIQTGLKCLLSHWIAVFSFVFGKRKEEVEKLQNAIKSYEFKSSTTVANHGTDMDETQENILELAIALFNSAESNKTLIIKEPQFKYCKEALLDYLSIHKRC